jgi:hypothetical protein
VHANRYDTVDQAMLGDADKQFLGCLRNIPESAKISAVGQTYRNLYILGEFLTCWLPFVRCLVSP